MSEVYETLTGHRSIRSYTDEPVSDEQLTKIIEAVQAAPTSINGQQVTVISVQDPVKKAKIAELAGNQAWIAQAPVFLLFCADYHRARVAAEMNGQELVITSAIESIVVGATDVGIALGRAIAMAASLGLGTVPIGGARRSPLELIELLELPKYVFPVSGLVVGHPADTSHKKHRLPQAAIWHREGYHQEQMEALVREYDEQVSTYMQERTGGKESRNWSQTVSSFYNRIYYPEVRKMLEQQGFDFQ
ncbi:NADPH-dependent oxidoreductase [Paenibacillus daejeonensis]|uniref:NADPH-dependent oxidoreductase n=1 Tax=Paenibacillus daejeonensis TaxID=135193 RepID=UPI0003633811|nr:NADPH-dependent oxidoreductase [Paenibacillus daejeonensis]